MIKELTLPSFTTNMISFDQGLVLLVLAFILVSLFWRIIGVSFTLLLGIITLGIFGVITPSEIVSGLGNEQVSVVILMLLFSDLIRKTDIIEFTFEKFFRRVRSYRQMISRMVLGAAGFSMFLNNAPVVSVTMPYMNNWAKRNNYPPSKFLIPLSYAAIIGGSATLIGTSANLIINSMIINQKVLPGLNTLNVFDFALVGIPMILIGWIYLVLLSNKLLPSKAGVPDTFKSGAREYHIEAKVKARSHLIGKTLAESGLLEIKGLRLTAILRKSFRIVDVPADIILDFGDVLVFKGETRNITDLLSVKSGLILPEVGMLTHVRHANVNEVVISQNSTLINKSVRSTNFRGRYDAAIIAVHRNGERIEGKLGSVVLRSGDVLLLFAGENFVSRSKDSPDFYFISKVTEYINLEWYKTLILLGGVALVIILAAANVISLFMGLILMILVSMALKVIHPKDITNNIDYNLALTIVLSLALGTAMAKSDTASLIADWTIAAFFPFGKTGVLVGLYIITALLSAYITTFASLALIFPVALSISQQLGVSATPFILAIAYASACTFITPHGYVTNLMVYGPGGYSRKDFLRIGLPLTFIYMIVAITILSKIYF